jgi:hypothetical protein
VDILHPGFDIVDNDTRFLIPKEKLINFGKPRILYLGYIRHPINLPGRLTEYSVGALSR